ncbi:hypothetical protein [Chitinophaga qingshengii]|uniref:Uncharacterized protein n=1 Tax=Chitinophaga qingshengii TaxID=1569794 RepID=A0ABR7TRJ9_9BACT|nr:hypothetical protein [Chitinophaga qingshengii]MBC9932613.1 hypothetical protein [Chitinophaga qingshengii]
MHHPLTLLSAALLSALQQEGYKIFVRQSYPAGISTADTHVREAFLLTPYKDIASANAHFQHIRFDRRKYIYQSFHPEEVEKLYQAASQPAGYKIYVALIDPEHQTPDPALTLHIRRYISQYTAWPPEHIHLQYALHYGELYLSLQYGDEEIKVPLPAIESYYK